MEFDLEPTLRCEQREPLIVHETLTDARIERRLEVPKDYVFLQGHFDGFPVVAGVVQLRWVMDALRAWRGETPHTSNMVAIEALKFPEPLLPGQAVSLEIEPARQAGCFRFRVWDGARTFASGRWVGRSSS